MSPQSLRLLRFTIVVQLLVSAWFVFSPDLLPSALVVAEMQNDQPVYAWIDSIIVPIGYLQTLLCAVLWVPTKTACWLYVGCLGAIAGLSAFAGPAMLSAIDSVAAYLQILASGAMIASLYSSGLFLLWSDKNT